MGLPWQYSLARCDMSYLPLNRWYYDSEVVKLIALVIEGSVLPFTVGVAPRLVPKEKQSRSRFLHCDTRR